MVFASPAGIELTRNAVADPDVALYEVQLAGDAAGPWVATARTSSTGYAEETRPRR